MKIKEFNKNLNIITTKGFLDKNKLNLLSNQTKTDIVYFIIKKNMQIWKDLIPENFDKSIFNSLGYIHETVGKFGYVFIHRESHKIIIDKKSNPNANIRP